MATKRYMSKKNLQKYALVAYNVNARSSNSRAAKNLVRAGPVSDVVSH